MCVTLGSSETLIIRISLPGSSLGELTYMAHRCPALLALISAPHLYNKNKHTHRYSYIRCSLSFIRELNAHSRLCSVSFMPHGGFWVLNSLLIISYQPHSHILTVLHPAEIRTHTAFSHSAQVYTSPNGFFKMILVQNNNR